ncbi:hypothetical protein ElyMa_006902000 [Elysia marginata]|uniref:Uncharacterized protein n=1 Tax=Elysia marginata TaxID=1093978 RepID=A0AAV4JDV5_9GAST|nr:hypothetical protein ElyMa_006902000 [Elysia marginata]
MLPWVFRSNSLLFTFKPTCYPGSSSPRAHCLPLDQHATLGLLVQESTVYHKTSMLPWVFRSKSLLSTTRTARYPGFTGPKAYCLPLDQHATLGLPVQKPTVYD